MNAHELQSCICAAQRRCSCARLSICSACAVAAPTRRGPRSLARCRPGAAAPPHGVGAPPSSGGLDRRDLQQQDELRRAQAQMSAGASVFFNEDLLQMTDLGASLAQMHTHEPLGWDAALDAPMGSKLTFSGIKAEDLEEFGPNRQ